MTPSKDAMTKHTSSDELLGEIGLLLQNYDNARGQKEIDEAINNGVRSLEAYIKTNYILKADVVEAIGEDEPEDTDLGDGRTSVDNQKRGANKLRSKLLESLNLEGGRDGQK